MLTILAIIIAAATLIILHLRAEQAQLARFGSMSQRWLDEHRAEAPS